MNPEDEIASIEKDLAQMDKEMKAEIDAVKERYKAAKAPFIKRKSSLVRKGNQDIWVEFLESQLEYVVGAFEKERANGRDLCQKPQGISLPNRNVESIVLPSLGETAWAGFKGEIWPTSVLSTNRRPPGAGQLDAVLMVEFSGHISNGMPTKTFWGPKIFPIDSALDDSIEYLSKELEKIKAGKVPPLGEVDIFRPGR